MSTTVNLYTISFQCGENPTSYSVLNFLNDIGAMLNTKAQERQLIRDIDGKILRCFPYYYSMSRQTVVIPFGKIKQKISHIGSTTLAIGLRSFRLICLI